MSDLYSELLVKKKQTAKGYGCEIRSYCTDSDHGL